MSFKPQDSLLARDAKHIWHPYTQHGNQPKIIGVKSARGAYLELENGEHLLDAISSWWVNLLGHAQPDIAAAIARQAASLEHVVFAGFTHEPAVKLAGLLIEGVRAAGAALDRVFYSDNGSTAVEVALKMAYQYHYNRGHRNRHRFLALRGAYHGDTLGAMAVGEPDGFHTPFRRLLPSVEFFAPDDIASLKTALFKHPGEYAAWIVEPRVQGAGGMRFHSAEFLREAAAICAEHDILVIADEVFTGFYRTDSAFAFTSAQISPDFVCLSKGITGGFLPLAVTLTHERIFDAFATPQLSEAFLHGHSYTANPIACAAALASWEVLHRPDTQAQHQMICAETAIAIDRLSRHPRGQNARAIGTIGAIDLQSNSGYFQTSASLLAQRAIAQGVLLRPLGGVLYALPPLCFTQQEIIRTYQVLESLLDS